eukprot:7055608-Prymnesium_polylepis.1
MTGGGEGRGGGSTGAGGTGQHSSPGYPAPAAKQLCWQVLAEVHPTLRLHLFCSPQDHEQSRPLLTISVLGISVHTVHGGGAGGEGAGQQLSPS